MNKKIFARFIVLIFLVISNFIIFKTCNLESKNVTLSYNIYSDKADTYQIFYGEDLEWKEEQSEKVEYTKVNTDQNLKFEIPKGITLLRFDLGNQEAHINIRDITVSSFGKKIRLNIDDLLSTNNKNQILNLNKTESGFEVDTNGNDPYIVYNLDSDILTSFDSYFEIINKVVKVFICIVLDLLVIMLLKKSKNVISLILELKNNKELIWNLAKNDFKTKYAGSYLGITWAFVQPIVTILVYWLVFQYGLRAGSPIEGVPYVLWLISGLIPWFFFQEALLNATNCMLEYSYLVKKVVFKISILPIVKIISALFVHLVFIGFLFFVAAIYGFYPTMFSIQLIYYSFCTFCLTLALSYATSAIVIFFRDLGQIINIFLQVGMWMTPIMWSYTMVPENLRWIVKLNPMYYIVEGYRDTFINNVWFIDRYFQTVYFWVFTLGLFGVGTILFKKLKPHFADVL